MAGRPSVSCSAGSAKAGAFEASFLHRMHWIDGETQKRQLGLRIIVSTTPQHESPHCRRRRPRRGARVPRTNSRGAYGNTRNERCAC